MKKRHFFTGCILVIFLVCLVSFVRYTKGTSSAGASDNLKVKGAANAPVTMVLYSDFQCPACKHALPPIEELRAQFPSTLKIEFRHYPLERPHKWALMAATFAQCAAEQGKFWEFHDKLYASQEIWSAVGDALPIFAGLVQEVGLDSQRLESCIQNPETLKQIQKERSLGTKQGVESTPTIFINGHMLVGALQLREKGAGIITEELKKHSAS